MTPNRKIDRPRRAGHERDSDGLAALAVHEQGAVSALETEQFNVSTDRL